MLLNEIRLSWLPSSAISSSMFKIQPETCVDRLAMSDLSCKMVFKLLGISLNVIGVLIQPLLNDLAFLLVAILQSSMPIGSSLFHADRTINPYGTGFSKALVFLLHHNLILDVVSVFLDVDCWLFSNIVSGESLVVNRQSSVVSREELFHLA